ncbi:hypothetical protein QFZ34_002112 [Phyllobacterium ifriqiyense]|uniref:Uncharacterized protein n=1 Tax=Phyllobacterium ifriqiyense TaxID=314238 RepID=A0ABU0S864_9HYPH|nr:hypothetical protein [Phyllobacterium ifriqiyense]
MCCCAIWEGTREALEKFPICEDCQGAHVDEGGNALEGCGYSPVECNTCGWRPCDGSC